MGALQWLVERLGGLLLLLVCSALGWLFLLGSLGETFGPLLDDGIGGISSVRVETARPLTVLEDVARWASVPTSGIVETQGWIRDPSRFTFLSATGLILIMAVTFVWFWVPREAEASKLPTTFGWFGIALLAELGRPAFAWMLVIVLGTVATIVALRQVAEREYERREYYFTYDSSADTAANRIRSLLLDYGQALVWWPLRGFGTLFEPFM